MMRFQIWVLSQRQEGKYISLQYDTSMFGAFLTTPYVHNFDGLLKSNFRVPKRGFFVMIALKREGV